MTEQINSLLRQSGLAADLSAAEISRIIDPHMPTDGESRRGPGGLDWSALAAGPLSGMTIRAVRTSGYIEQSNPAVLPARWRARDREFSDRFPLDGCSFSMLWHKPVETSVAM